MHNYQLFGLVRDGKTGAPKVDDPSQLHPMILGMMTLHERQALGVRSGDWVRDAQGLKLVTAMPDGSYRAEDPLVAASELFVLAEDGSGAIVRTISPRCDVPAGGVLSAALIS